MTIWQFLIVIWENSQPIGYIAIVCWVVTIVDWMIRIWVELKLIWQINTSVSGLGAVIPGPVNDALPPILPQPQHSTVAISKDVGKRALVLSL